MVFYDEIAIDVSPCELDKGMVELIGILNAKGIVTNLSCDGHGKSNAWVILESAHFKGFMKAKKFKMQKFLNIGETRWKLQLNYYGVSKFKGIGKVRPRLNELRRIVHSEMTAILVLDGPAMLAGEKTRNMKALEKAATAYL